MQLYDIWSWGLQGLFTIRTATHDNGYTLGNRLDLSAWIAWLQKWAHPFTRTLTDPSWKRILS